MGPAAFKNSIYYVFFPIILLSYLFIVISGYSIGLSKSLPDIDARISILLAVIIGLSLWAMAVFIARLHGFDASDTTAKFIKVALFIILLSASALGIINAAFFYFEGATVLRQAVERSERRVSDLQNLSNRELPAKEFIAVSNRVMSLVAQLQSEVVNPVTRTVPVPQTPGTRPPPVPQTPGTRPPPVPQTPGTRPPPVLQTPGTRTLPVPQTPVAPQTSVVQLCSVGPMARSVIDQIRLDLPGYAILAGSEAGSLNCRDSVAVLNASQLYRSTAETMLTMIPLYEKLRVRAREQLQRSINNAAEMFKARFSRVRQDIANLSVVPHAESPAVQRIVGELESIESQYSNLVRQLMGILETATSAPPRHVETR